MCWVLIEAALSLSCSLERSDVFTKLSAPVRGHSAASLCGRSSLISLSKVTYFSLYRCCLSFVGFLLAT